MDGNLSVRLDKKRILVTPTCVSKGAMRGSDMVIVDPEGVRVAGRRNVTSEIGMHLLIYRMRPDIRAIVHAHPPTATGFAAAGMALTEPLPVPPVILLGVAGAILFCAGLIAGNGGAVAAPVAFLFSLFVGSIISTQLHQAFRPQAPPVDEFNGLISLHFPEVVGPLLIAVAIGAVGGLVGERILPSQKARRS